MIEKRSVPTTILATPTTLVVAFLAAALAACTSSAPQADSGLTPQQKAARKELARRGQPYASSAFHASASEGKTDLVQLYLDAGMAVDATDEYGITALMAASAKGRADVVSALLAAKADPSLGSEKQEPPLFQAVQFGHLETARLLVKGGARVDAVAGPPQGDSPLGRALSLGHDEIAALLLESGANANGPGDGVRTPLMIAAEAGKLDLVRQLLAKGSDANGQAPGGATALNLAVSNGHTDVVKALLAAGADARREKDALLSAAERSRKPEIRKLLQQALRKPMKTVPRPAPAATPGSPTGVCEGTFTVGDETIQLAFAYAIAQKGAFDPKKEDVLVILSDVPLDTSEVEDWSKRTRLADDGKLHAIELTIDAKRQVIGGNLLNSATGMTSVSVTGMHVFEPKVMNRTTISGKAFVKEPTDLFGKTTFQYTATFSASIYRKPKAIPATAAQRGAAEKSPQAKAYRAYETALAAGDLAALRKTVVAELAREISDDPDAAKKVELMKLFQPTAVRFEKVTVEGSKATLEAAGSSDGQKAKGTIELLLEEGAWKVGKQSWSSGP